MDPTPNQKSGFVENAFSASLSAFRAIGKLFERSDPETLSLEWARSKISEEYWSRLQKVAPGTEILVEIGESNSFLLEIREITEQKISDSMMREALDNISRITSALGAEHGFSEENLAEIAIITDRTEIPHHLVHRLLPQLIGGRFNGANISLRIQREGQSSLVSYSGTYSTDGSASENFTREQAESLYQRITSLMELQRYEKIPTHLEYLILDSLRKYCIAEFGPPSPPPASEIFKF